MAPQVQQRSDLSILQSWCDTWPHGGELATVRDYSKNLRSSCPRAFACQACLSTCVSLALALSISPGVLGRKQLSWPRETRPTHLSPTFRIKHNISLSCQLPQARPRGPFDLDADARSWIRVAQVSDALEAGFWDATLPALILSHGSSAAEAQDLGRSCLRPTPSS